MELRKAGWNSEQLAGVFLSTHRAQPDKSSVSIEMGANLACKAI